MRSEHQCWAIRNCFNLFLKLLIIRFLFLREGGVCVCVVRRDKKRDILQVIMLISV